MYSRSKAAKAATLAVVLLLLSAFVPLGAWGARAPDPAWTAEGTHWSASSTLSRDEAARFHDLWTTRFFDSVGLQAYLDRPGLYDDGFNALPESEKAALVVGLIDHWQRTLPAFGAGFWTGVPAEDQKHFEQLAVMLYATIFAKDEFKAALAGEQVPAADVAGPPTPIDAQNPHFPGKSQEEIVAYFDALQADERVIRPPPALPEMEVPDELARPGPVEIAAPLAPGILHDLAANAVVATPSETPPQVTLEPVDVPGVARYRSGSGTGGILPTPPGSALPTPGSILDVIPEIHVVPTPPDPNTLLNLVAAGTYLACGSQGAGAVVCAPTSVPLGTAVALDLDGNVLTGVLGAEVTVLLSPSVHPDHAVGGFSATLRVDRTIPSTVPTSAALPAQAFVVYAPPGASMQIVAGFDARDDTLDDTQSLQVTLKDVALALAGDVRLLGEMTTVGPGTKTALLAGFATLDTLAFPPALTDPTTIAIHFDPAPPTLAADLRFAEIPTPTIHARITSELSPTVTSVIEMTRGDSHRRIEGVVVDMPTDLTIDIASGAEGAVALDYAANAPFPRFELHDVLVHDVAAPLARSTLDVVVLDIPSTISFDLARPFDISYQAASVVTSAALVMATHDAAGVVTSVAASVQGVPSQWSISGDDDPLAIDYLANGNIDVIDAAIYDRARSLSANAHVEDIPAALSLLLDDERILFTATQPIGLIEASMSVGGLTPWGAIGEYASFRADGTGRIAGGARVAGMSAFDLDQRTLDHVIADVTIAGGEPFTAIVDTPEAYATAVLSNLPTNIHADLGPTSFTYDLAEPVASLSVHAEVADLAADVLVTNLPDELALSWTQTSLVYDANAPVGRVQMWLDKGALDAYADVQNVPADWAASWPSGTATFAAEGAIGSVEILAQVNGGAIYALPGDHVSLVKSGSVIGAGLKLTGIRSFSADPRTGGAYALGLAPGGQTFRVYADVDGLHAQAYVSNLPQDMSLTLTPGTNRFAYAGTAGITNVWVYADSATSPLYAYANLVGLPARVNLSWATGTAPIIVYDASASVTSIYGYFVSASGSAYETNVASLPPYLRIQATTSDIVVDARSSSTAASGSGTAGSILARYGSDGSFLYGSGNYAYLYQTASVTRASVGYDGMKYIRVGQAADNLVVEVLNSAPRLFYAYADTPDAYVSMTIDSIPSHVKVTGSGTVFTYNAYGTTIQSISAYFWDKASTTVSATVRGIPDFASLNLNMPATQITYSAAAPIASIDVDAWIGAWYGMLRISSVPTYWTATFGGGTYLFDTTAPCTECSSSAFEGGPELLAAPIGSVRVAVTNHGAYGTLAGNHLHVKSVAGGPIDASLLMTSVAKAQYTRSGTQNVIDLRMGGGTPFNLLADATLPTGEQAYLSATFTPLPSSIQATFGEKTTITASQNFDLSVYGQFGTAAALAATPTPPTHHGAAVRDGASGIHRGIKGRLWLTGLPTSVTIDPRNSTFGFANWRPSMSSLVLDAELDNFVSPSIDAYIQQLGIPNPQSLTFTMSTTDLGGGAKRVKIQNTLTSAMGQLYADLNAGGQHGQMVISNIPDDIVATYTLTNGQGSFVWDATAPISSIDAGFRVVAQSGTFQGTLNLDQLPSDFSLTYGRAGGGEGPTLTYTANANTLDVSAYVDASLYANDAKARLSFGLTDLGANVNVYQSGNGIRFTSTPATANIYANVWATYNHYQQSSGTLGSGWLTFPWAYHLGVTPTIYNLAVTLTNFSDFSMTWGVTSKLAGSYNTFSLSWSSFTVNLHAYGKFQIEVDWPTPFGSSTITLVDTHYHPPTFNLDVLFHKYTNHQGTWFSTGGTIICDWTLAATIRPHPHGTSWNGFTTSAASAEGGATYITPNPWGALPAWGIDLTARYTSPDGGSGPGLSFDFDCW